MKKTLIMKDHYLSSQSCYIVKTEWNNHLPVIAKVLHLAGQIQYDQLLIIISFLSSSFVFGMKD